MSQSAALAKSPRAIDPAQTFDALVSWVADLAEKKNAPGFIVGISGTDSILTYLVCAQGMEKLGKADRVLGVHYGQGFRPADELSEHEAQKRESILALSPNYMWVPRVIVPWLQEKAPEASIEIDNRLHTWAMVDPTLDPNDDRLRWALLHRRALNGAHKREPLPEGENFWVVGTHNATERQLGSYSNLSTAVSMQPIVHLWKSEVLQICAHLGVPHIAIENSRQVDCDCGRFDVAADHIEEVDAVLMARKGILSPSYIRATIAPELWQSLKEFVRTQAGYAGFKGEIPYEPNEGQIIVPKSAKDASLPAPVPT